MSCSRRQRRPHKQKASSPVAVALARLHRSASWPACLTNQLAAGLSTGSRPLCCSIKRLNGPAKRQQGRANAWQASSCGHINDDSKTRSWPDLNWQPPDYDWLPIQCFEWPLSRVITCLAQCRREWWIYLLQHKDLRRCTSILLLAGRPASCAKVAQQPQCCGVASCLYVCLSVWHDFNFLVQKPAQPAAISASI